MLHKHKTEKRYVVKHWCFKCISAQHHIWSIYAHTLQAF